ncbi:hypothetical protein E4191_16530 (plasmid) [Paracoccus liaowanqingii]|uniref:Uncharacterized protein n=1 Tax=Paracoccus liaowanqingii TaxID=2560053 RepID=A0A4Y5SQL0_9RHOB|nr:hypothetical protein [Paracoccus liaowanqingii]QDA35771.1 hypothetical protein E4191_16530 [Paracoccus liaowanqingii]
MRHNPGAFAPASVQDTEPFLDLLVQMNPDTLRKLAAMCEARQGGLEVMAEPLRAYADQQARSTAGSAA